MRPPGQVAAWLGPALLAASALVFAVLVLAQAARPLVYDDANFALAAAAVADTGLPFGNQGWMSDRGDLSHQVQWALWHPPLYVYLLGAAARVGGWTPPVLRLVGLAGGLASGLLVYRLAHRLTHAEHPAERRLAGGVAAALTLLCPLAVQSALVLDIDLPLLLPLMLGFVLAYARLADSPRWPLLAPLFGLLLWAKMTNPLPLLAVAATWQVLRGRPGAAARDLLGVGGGGVVLFGLSWVAVGGWLGWPLDMPFAVNAAQWQDSADVARRAYAGPDAFLAGLRPTAAWIGPGLVALGLAGTGVRAAALARGWRVLRVDLILGLLVLLILGYVNKSAGWFPKYQVALVPLLACLAAPVVARVASRRAGLALGSAVLGAGVAWSGVWATGGDAWARDRAFVLGPVQGAVLLAPVLLAGGVGLARRAASVGALGALLGVALGWSAATDVWQARADYSTGYWYGTVGTADAADWVDGHLAPGDLYVAAKEVAVRARARRYVDQDSLLTVLGTGHAFDGTWRGEPVAAVVAWERDRSAADLLDRALPPAGFDRADRLGDYQVYLPRARPPAAATSPSP